MCVAVTLMTNTNLTLEEITKMQLCNRDGVGLAWVQDGEVRWLKGLNPKPEDILNILEQVKESPRLLHFRLSTAGGVKVELCHPFEIGPEAKYEKSGRGQKVMIHNGHWGGWNDLFSLLNNVKMLPRNADGSEQPWSDSRLIAFLSHEDEEWLETLGGRVATMDSSGEIKYLGNWEDLREGIRVSNTGWQRYSRVYEAPKNEKKGPTGTVYGQGGQSRGQGYSQSYNSSHGYRTTTFHHAGVTIHAWRDPKGVWQFYNTRTKKMDEVDAEDPVSAIKAAIDGNPLVKPAGGGPFCDYVKGKDCGLLVSDEHEETCSKCPYSRC